jgi:hypothetical protein|tara:strand:+ start:26 stop:469 length:444 start_codon:yes stop_codon:yes gene_type:complete
MSKTISYKGTLAIGQEDRISLSTIQGKVGYKITKFQIIGTTPGQANAEYVGKITKVKDPNIGPTVKFTDSDLLAIAYYQDNEGSDKSMSKIIIFDNEMFNQDIFVNITDASGGTVPCNYYFELQTINLSELETTMLTLKSLRTVTSR